MQAAKPRPNLTFTYADPPELPRPYYRMVLVFDAANDLTAMSVCAGTIRHKPPVASRPFNVFAIYCRNDLALSQTTAWTNASGPNDPQVQALFAQLFLVLFDDSPRRRFPFRPVRPLVAMDGPAFPAQAMRERPSCFSSSTTSATTSC